MSALPLAVSWYVSRSAVDPLTLLQAGDSMGMLDRAEVDKTGIQMSSHSRAMLMDKLSAAHDGGQSKSAGGPKPTVHIPELARGMSPVATNFLLLKHMFDPKKSVLLLR